MAVFFPTQGFKEEEEEEEREKQQQPFIAVITFDSSGISARGRISASAVAQGPVRGAKGGRERWRRETMTESK